VSHVRVSTEALENVGLLVFQNPPHNYATIQLLRDIAEGLERLNNSRAIRAIVLASEGKAFCAGADLLSENGFGGATDDPLREFYAQAMRIFEIGKPIVAAVQGAAIGAGLGLALAADFRVASIEARFSANFVKLGFHPGFALTHTLPRVVGRQRAAQIFLTGARYKSEEAFAWGLIDRLTGPDTLRKAALEFAAEIAENAPLSLLATRATLRGRLVVDVRTAMQHEHSEQLKLRQTTDHAEGIRAVTERRRGNFTGS
jgi:enoyl-CoA hydratase/carnithine racemase